MTTLDVQRNKGILSTYKSTSGQYVRNEAMIIPQISPINKPEGKFIIAVKEQGITFKYENHDIA